MLLVVKILLPAVEKNLPLKPVANCPVQAPGAVEIGRILVGWHKSHQKPHFSFIEFSCVYVGSYLYLLFRFFGLPWLQLHLVCYTVGHN